jgi:hypothetical protein
MILGIPLQSFDILVTTAAAVVTIILLITIYQQVRTSRRVNKLLIVHACKLIEEVNATLREQGRNANGKPHQCI